MVMISCASDPNRGGGDIEEENTSDLVIVLCCKGRPDEAIWNYVDVVLQISLPLAMKILTIAISYG